MWPLFFYFQYGFRSSWSTADILTVVSDKIARTSNRSRATQVVALDTSKDFNRVWHTDFLHKLNSDSELESDLWSVLEEKYLLRCCWSWLSLPNWTEAPTLSLLLKPPKIGALICSMKFLSPEVSLYLYKSTIWPYMEYCCHAWAGAPSCYLELLDMQDCRSFTCCLSWTLGLSLKCSQLKSFL